MKRGQFNKTNPGHFDFGASLRKPHGESSFARVEGGGIGMNVGGHVIVAPIERWHEAAELLMCVNPCLPEWRRKLAMWLLNARVKGYKHPTNQAHPQPVK